MTEVIVVGWWYLRGEGISGFLGMKEGDSWKKAGWESMGQAGVRKGRMWGG